jgi:hypothetical protein
MLHVEKTTSIIEYLRGKMIGLAEINGELTHADVVRVSQKLDLYLTQEQLYAKQAHAKEASRNTYWASAVGRDSAYAH